MASSSSSADRLFTRQFFLIWSYSFIVFLSAFQLLPTAPFHILALGGSQLEAGLFLGFLTYASAASAPITGAIADRLGKRRVLMVASLAITLFSVLYAIVPTYQVMLALVLVHGVFWSGLLSSSSSYVLDIVPASRRAEGLGYSGFASVMGIAIAPWVGLWLFEHGGWSLLCVEAAALNVVMFVIAWILPPDRRHAHPRSLDPRDLVEWRVLIGAVTLFLYSFSYGAITSFVAVYAEQIGVAPKALYFSAFCFTIIVTRPFIGRYADRVGHARLIVPCLALIVMGVWMLAAADSRAMFVMSALLFGVGFGLSLIHI